MSKKKIAIVEDDIELLKLLGSLCEDLNYEPHEFRTYEDFIFKYPKILPDLIISDRNLPGMNGNEIIKTIRTLDSNIPILMISGSNSSENVIEALRLGANDFIGKPFHPDILTLKINKFLAPINSDPPLQVNSRTKLIQLGKQEISLTTLEFKIFEQLLNRLDNFVARDELMEEGTSRSLDVHINKIRKKIIPINYAIETIRSSGYRLKKIS